MRTKFLSRRGFTLIELLTVIAIIGILAGMAIPIMAVVKKKAKIAASKAAFQQMCTAVEQYKAEYATYPYIGGQYKTNDDTFIQLNNTAAVTEFIKCLSGRTPIWEGNGALSAGAGGDARKFNRNAKEFYAFPPDVIQTSDNGAYTQLLCDKFGNTSLNLLMDTDGNGMVKPTNITTGTPSDYGIDQNGYINRKVVIYTLKGSSTDYEDVLSWQ